MSEIENIELKYKQLSQLNEHLKSKFCGIDSQIDKITKAMTPWFVDDSLMDRPIVINLWGLTGTGKTELVREIQKFINSEVLNLNVPFVEADCRCLYEVFDLLKKNKAELKESNRFLFLFDEFQFARTINEKGVEVYVTFISSLLGLFNDGKIEFNDFNAASKNPRALLAMINDLIKNKGKFTEITKSLFLNLFPNKKEKILEIFCLKTEEKIVEELLNLKEAEFNENFYLKKSLIFVSANIDEAFRDVKEIDSDLLTADELYRKTKSVTINDIKNSLFKRFRPEQISRLGNNHVIFHSINEESYRKIISEELFKINTSNKFNIKVDIDASIHDFIYTYGVIPSQGTRNLFSFINSTFKSRVPMMYLSSYGKSNNPLLLFKDGYLILKDGENEIWKEEVEEIKFPVLHDDPKYQNMVAVHEAGHAVVWYGLTNTAPELIKSKTNNSKSGGFVKTPSLPLYTKKDYKNQISTLLAGYLAERNAFGEDGVSGGCHGDLDKATEIASLMVRELGMGGHIGSSNQNGFKISTLKTLAGEDDQKIELLLKECEENALQTLQKYKGLHKELSEILKVKNTVTKEEFLNIAKIHDQQSEKSNKSIVFNFDKNKTED